MIDSEVYLALEIGNKKIPFITDAVVNMWIVLGIIILALYLSTKNLKTKPKKFQNLAEIFLDFINGFSKKQIGEDYKTFAPFLATVFLFLIVSNMLALISIIPNGTVLSIIFNNESLKDFRFAIAPPTKNFNVPLALAILSMTLVFLAELKYKGGKAFIQSFYKPSPVFGFVKILDFIMRPFSLCLRLFGNIVGGFIVMTLIYSVAPIFFPAVISAYFEIFDGALQAYVFIFLLSLYLKEAVEKHN